MATNGARYSSPDPFEIDSTGGPLVGGQLFTYVTGTSTPLATYSDSALSIPNSNPIVADSNGRFGSVWLVGTQAYKIALYGPIPAGTSQSNSTPASPLGTEIWTQDPVGPAASGTIANTAGIVGEIRYYGGPFSSIPTGWYACYGQAVSRTTYSAAFAVIGTTFGSGDGSTTFNLPDCRGRLLAGLDNMGGTAANRITSGVSGISGTTLGAAGGGQASQADTLTATTSITDPGHSHTFTHPGGTGGQIAGTSAWIGSSVNTSSTNSTVTGLTASTTVTSSLTGTTQNVQPTMMVNVIIYLAA